jgi:AAA family ATP:ADP antiporter
VNEKPLAKHEQAQLAGSPADGSARHAVVSLFLLSAAHQLTETARDGLFLQRLPVTLLPWIYVTMGVLALLGTRALAHLPARFRKAGVLRLLLTAAALISLAFWQLSLTGADWVLIALYIWPALFGSIVLVKFWQVLSDQYTMADAKRVYGQVGAGGMAGGLFGGGVGVLLTSLTSARHLLAAAAAILALAAWRAERVSLSPAATAPEPKPTGLIHSARVVFQHRYIFRVALMLFGSAALVTLVQYEFRAEVVRNVTREQLPLIFAAAGFGFSLLQIIVQLIFVERWLRQISITGALAVMPALLGVAALGIVLGAGLVAAFALGAIEGVFKGSMHRTATELLYVPMTRRMRTRLKALVDVAGQRGGQVVASLGILGCLAVGLGPGAVAVVIVGVAVTLVALVVSLRTPYLDLFRKSLATEMVETRFEVPTLDLKSLSSVFAAFNSPRPSDQIAAMDLLAAEGQTAMIPVLTLFFPSPQVVAHALELFVRDGRTDFFWVANSLAEKSPDPEIRRVALRASLAANGDVALALRSRTDPAPEVRATALVALVADERAQSEHAESMRAIEGMRLGSCAERQALAGAIALSPHARFTELLRQLAEDAAETERLGILEAMKRQPSEAYLPFARDMLEFRQTREAARDVLESIGRPALAFLSASLEDLELPHDVRLHVPRSMSRFGLPAVDPLQRRLVEEKDDMVQYKVLRGLGRLRVDHPDAEFDLELLLRLAADAADRAVHYAGFRDALNTDATPAEQLLRWLLDGHSTVAKERLFRLLGLMQPGEDFERIYRGLRGDRTAWASSRELVEHAVDPALRPQVLAVCDLTHADTQTAPPPPPRLQVLETLLSAERGVLRCAAAACIAELDAPGLERELERALLEEPEIFHPPIRAALQTRVKHAV